MKPRNLPQLVARLLVCLCGLMGCLSACIPVKDLSDQVQLRSFVVIECEPEEVRLAPVRIEGENIIIPVDYGKYLFPLTLHFRLDMPTAPADILGIKAEDSLVFERMDQTYTFHLVAPSGVAHPFTISLEEVPHSEEAAVTSFSIESRTPEDYRLLSEPVVDASRSLLGLYVFRGNFPYVVHPKLEVSPAARLQNPVPRDGYVFNSLQDSYEIKVVSESGFVRTWTLALLPLKEVEDPSKLEAAVRARMTPVDLQCTLMPAGLTITQMELTDHDGRVSLQIRPKQPDFPLSLTATFTSSPYTRRLLSAPDAPLVYSNWTQTDTLFLADLLTEQVCAWEFALSPWLNNQAEVEAFTPLDYSTPKGSMGLSSVEIDREEATLTLVTDGGFDFPLTMAAYEMRLSEDAQASLPASFVFDTYDQVVDFKVQASDGAEKNWRIVLQVDLPSACEVLDFQVTDFRSAGNDLRLGTVAIDPAARRLVLPVTAGTGFPLTLEACEVSVSDHARAQLPETLTFAHYTDSLSFTVQAFDGTTSAWTLALQPWFRLGKNLFSFDVERYRSAQDRVTLGQVVVDSVKREVGIEVTDGFDFPLVLEQVQMRLSPGATVVEDYAAGWVFDHIQSSLPLTLRAESGETAAWTLRLIDRRTASHEAEVEYYQIVSYQGTSQTAHNMVLRPQAVIDNQNRVITLQIDDWGNKFPLTVEGRLGITHSAHLEEAAFDLTHTLVFDNVHSTHSFTVVSESYETRRPWVLRLQDLGPNRGAEVELLHYELLDYHGTSTTENKLVLSPTPLVDPQAREITFQITDWAYKMPLHIQARWQASEGATGSVMPEHSWVFDHLDQVHSFTLTSEDGQYSRLWKVRVENVGPDRGKVAELLDFRLEAYQGTSLTENNLVLDPQVLRDEVAKTLTLVVTDWSHKFPLTVETGFTLSPEATVSPSSGLDRQLWVFDRIDSKQTFTLTSPDGTVTETWTLQLEDRTPVKSSEAQVLNFAFASVPPGFVLDEKYLEPSKNRITLVVRERPSASSVLSIRPSVSLSPGARLVGFTSGEALDISFDRSQTLTVMAEDESLKTWEVALIYGPQIPNSDFEQWGNDSKGIYNLSPSNGKGWTTSNNSQVSGCSRVQGYKGYGVCNSTTLNTVNLVVINVSTLAAGATFLGSFTLKTGYNDVKNPRSMTRFAIPFTGENKPIGYSIYYKYLPKSPRMFTRFKESTGLIKIPGFHDPVQVEGEDKAVFSVDLCNSNQANYEYLIDQQTGRIGGSEYLESREVSDWTLHTQYFTPVPGQESKPVTHISVRFASSYEGDYFKGGKGSALYIDEFKLLYYKPAEDAILLP